MMNARRRSILLGSLAAPLAHWPLAALAQAGGYPSKTIRIVVPLAPGGSADAMCRLLANGLTKVLGRTVIVDNRPGSGGVAGLAEVARAAPDGYTLGYSLAGALTVAPHLMKNMPFDALKDLAPLTQVVAVPEIVVAHPKLGVKTLPQLISYAKARPGKLNFGSAGNATIPHLGGELLKREAQIDMVHVPYKGSGPALNDLLAGQVEVMVSDVTLVRSHIESGRLVGLAVAGPARISELPGVATAAEAGLPGMLVSNWHGMVAPAGTPPAVLALLHKAIQQALALPEVKARIDLEGADAVGSSPAEFAAFLRRESAAWGALVKSLGIRWE
jgi:tripartite-type tricarboxylate transporter receptor subunit TctC